MTERLLSDPSAEASRSAFASLLKAKADPLPDENSLEGLTVELLRPMLQTWLDRELPKVVQRLVAAELAQARK